MVLIQLPDILGVFSVGDTFNGESIVSKHWHQVGGKYFVEINKIYTHEISQDNFNQLNHGLHRVFAIFWMVFSCVSIVIWDFLLRWVRSVSNTET